jgi:hypothetical protein
MKIYVNPSHIMLNDARRRANANAKRNPGNGRLHKMEPPVAIEFDDGKIEHGFGVEIAGPSRVIYDPTKDAVRVWIETDSEVTLRRKQ